MKQYAELLNLNKYKTNLNFTKNILFFKYNNMQIKPYILLVDKKTAVYDPNRMYSQQEVYGIVFSDITGEHIRVLSTKIIEEQKLLKLGIKMPESNIYPNEVDVLFDFNGNKNTYEFEIAGSEVVKNIKEQCGDEWFIPSLGELVAAIYCRDEIDNLLSHIENSYKFSTSIDMWISSRYSQYHAYYYDEFGGNLDGFEFCNVNTVVPITFIPDIAKHPKIGKTEIHNPPNNEIHLSNSNELLVEINNDNTNIKIYR